MNPPCCRKILHEEDTHSKTYGCHSEKPLKGWIKTYSLPLFAHHYDQAQPGSPIPRGGGGPSNAVLRGEVRRMSRHVANRESYERSGRAYVLASLSSHAQQRASASTGTNARAYLTPKMEEMVEASRRQSRKRGGSQQPWSQLKHIKRDLT